MEKDIIHVIKVPTTHKRLFPYSHFSDEYHSPFFSITSTDDYLSLEVRELFKLKPNNQKQPRNRVDIYMPVSTALSIGEQIITKYGPGQLAELNSINPENFRAGPQTLPVINEARTVKYLDVQFNIVGISLEGKNGRIYVDDEAPAEEHVEMKGKEIHFGIQLQTITGNIDNRFLLLRKVPDTETKVEGERDPIFKAIGYFKVTIDIENARNLASTLIHYCKEK